MPDNYPPKEALDFLNAALELCATWGPEARKAVDCGMQAQDLCAEIDEVCRLATAAKAAYFPRSR